MKLRKQLAASLLAAALAVSAVPMVPRVHAAEPVSTAARAEIPLQTASGRDSAHVSELDGTWKFGGQNLSDKKALSADYSSWSDVTIPHTWNATDGEDAKLGVFATIPAIKNRKRNFLSEVVGTFVLILVILFLSESGNTSEVGLGSIGALPVAFLVIVIGMALGGTTGYAINPARDFGPRMAHQLLRIKGKGSSRWEYAIVPFIGPLVGAVLAVVVYYIYLSCR